MTDIFHYFLSPYSLGLFLGAVLYDSLTPIPLASYEIQSFYKTCAYNKPGKKKISTNHSTWKTKSALLLDTSQYF